MVFSLLLLLSNIKIVFGLSLKAYYSFDGEVGKTTASDSIGNFTGVFEHGGYVGNDTIGKFGEAYVSGVAIRSRVNLGKFSVFLRFLLFLVSIFCFVENHIKIQENKLISNEFMADMFHYGL
jgi:hypothetical protein